MPSSNSASSSSTSQTTNAINPVVVADNGSFSVSGVAGGSLTQNITNNSLDKDVAIRAMDNTLTATQDALLFGNDAMRQSYAFVGDQTAQITAFAGQQTAQAYSFADASNQASKATSVAAINSAGSSMDKALAFGAKQTSVALDSLSQSADRIDTAYKDAKGVLSTNVILVAIAAGVVIVYFAMGRKN
jgi:hypothetical protein